MPPFDPPVHVEDFSAQPRLPLALCTWRARRMPHTSDMRHSSRWIVQHTHKPTAASTTRAPGSFRHSGHARAPSRLRAPTVAMHSRSSQPCDSCQTVWHLLRHTYTYILYKVALTADRLAVAGFLVRSPSISSPTSCSSVHHARHGREAHLQPLHQHAFAAGHCGDSAISSTAAAIDATRPVIAAAHKCILERSATVDRQRMPSRHNIRDGGGG